MEILGKLDESDITKLTQEPVHQPPPQHNYTPLPQTQRVSQPSSYLYQQHRIPMMNNPNMPVNYKFI